MKGSCLARREAEERAQCYHIYIISRDEGICIGEEYAYGLMPLLANAETIVFSISKRFLLETSELSNSSVLKYASPPRFWKSVREMGKCYCARHTHLTAETLRMDLLIT